MSKSRYIAKFGILLALACSLQFLEGMIPLPLPLGVKAGFSSIVIMYMLLYMNFSDALTAAVLKSGFVFITRGASAFCMSVCGGILSVFTMAIVVRLSHHSEKETGLVMLSVTGGIFHNIGQLTAASVISGSLLTASYLPVLVISGIISGIVTGTLLGLILPKIEKSAQRKGASDK